MAQIVVLLKCTPGWNLSQPRQNLQVKNEFHFILFGQNRSQEQLWAMGMISKLEGLPQSIDPSCH